LIMTNLPSDREPRLAIGLLAFVLGIVGLLVSFMPIVGIPISSCGLLVGVIGLIAALVLGERNLRWTVVGSAISALALIINLSLNFAPERLVPTPKTRTALQAAPESRFAPPPALPKRWH
jgi:hypothetical protein